MALSGVELAEWVARSCAAQGVPVKVSEARTVEQVRVLLSGQGGRTAPAREERTGRPVTAARAA